jgi:lipopolysaccharide/colanic/teichoic acid biosynthesis glycosyltransferase
MQTYYLANLYSFILILNNYKINSMQEFTGIVTNVAPKKIKPTNQTNQTVEVPVTHAINFTRSDAGFYSIVKRFFDIVCSIIALIILAPILLPIMVGLKFTGEGYILYLQERVGFKNKNFAIWKFATMLKNSPNMAGGYITTKKDPRLTPMGDFLRVSKINELPQLVNILFGNMSFVGPRPVMPASFSAYPNDVKEVIYNVKPGLTGIGSIIFRDEEQLITEVKEKGGDIWAFYKNEIYPYKGAVEKWYQANYSFKVDITIMFLTAWAIVAPKSDLVYKIFKDLPKRAF